MMYHLSYFELRQWHLEGGGVVSNLPPPSVSWFSSTPAGIGLIANYHLFYIEILGN